MHMPLYVSRLDVTLAEQLMADYGLEAGLEAAERAEQSRNVGNQLHFCRWRQIERLILMLSVDTTLGTVH